MKKAVHRRSTNQQDVNRLHVRAKVNTWKIALSVLLTFGFLFHINGSRDTPVGIVVVFDGHNGVEAC